jgi:RNA polymerase sigma-70 factor (ECF subfamily)
LTQEAFKQLFDSYFDKVRNYLYYRSGDAELATDIAQDTFMRIWEKQLAPHPGKEMGLLLKIGMDLFISRFRKQKREQDFTFHIAEDGQSESPEEVYAYTELQTKYAVALKAMEVNQRVVFLMNRNDGLTYQEIAQHLGLSQKAVEKRMSKALQYMRTKLLA